MEDPEREALKRLIWHACEAVEELATRDWSLPEASAGAPITSLADATADAPVAAQWTILASVKAAAEALRDIRTGMQSEGITPTALAALTRATLLASAKILYVLAPAGPDERVSHAKKIATMEANSLQRALGESKKFTTLTGLVPDATYLTSLERRLSAYTAQTRFGEAALLREVASIVDQRLRSEADSPGTSYEVNDVDGIEGQVREHVLWTFNNYSGIAHGFAWPKQIITIDDYLPGDWVADVWMTAALAQLAIQEAWKCWGHSN